MLSRFALLSDLIGCDSGISKFFLSVPPSGPELERPLPFYKPFFFGRWVMSFLAWVLILFFRDGVLFSLLRTSFPRNEIKSRTSFNCIEPQCSTRSPLDLPPSLGRGALFAPSENKGIPFSCVKERRFWADSFCRFFFP